jgi:hypothetical protein
MFTLTENGFYIVSSEEHFKNSKSSRGSYLDQELSTFVKIFKFNLSRDLVPLNCGLQAFLCCDDPVHLHPPEPEVYDGPSQRSFSNDSI